MGRKIILSFFLSFLFIVCLSCSSKPLPDNGVTILRPAANDVVKAGDSYEIRWKAEPAESEFGAMVTIEFSKDGGKSWEKVQENVENSGKYMWTVPKVESGQYEVYKKQCRLRVISQRKPIYRGTSEFFAVK